MKGKKEEDQFRKLFGERLQILLEDLNLNQSQFAKRIGVSQRQVSATLNEGSMPSVVFLKKLAETFPQVNTDWLTTGEGNKYRNKLEEERTTYRTYDLTRTECLEELKHIYTELSQLQELLEAKNYIIKLQDHRIQDLLRNQTLNNNHETTT